MSFNEFCIQNGIEIHSVPGDGHCLLWSTLYIVFDRDFSKYEWLKSQIHNEVINNLEYWANANGYSKHKLQQDMLKYLISKVYQNRFLDILPAILANILKANVVVYSVNKNNVYLELSHGQEYLPNKIMLKLASKHYSPMIVNTDSSTLPINYSVFASQNKSCVLNEQNNITVISNNNLLNLKRILSVLLKLFKSPLLTKRYLNSKQTILNSPSVLNDEISQMRILSPVKYDYFLF